MVGVNNPFYNKKHSDETVKIIIDKLNDWRINNPNEYAKAQSRYGSKNGMFGKHHSEETKKKISNKSKDRTFKMIGCRCIETNKEYRSINSAAKDLGVGRRLIYACCDDDSRHIDGLHFEYIR